MRKITFLLIAIAIGAFVQLNAQTILYENDFESGLTDGSTIVGNGVIEASGDINHGMVFHNNPGLTADKRTNYLLLPNTIFSDFQTTGSQGLTISFWVNDNGVAVDNSTTNYYWSAMFGAYGAAPNPINSKPAFTLMTRATGLVNFDYTNTVNGLSYGYIDFNSGADVNWLDAGGWHFYTFTITPTVGKVYIDGVLKNEYTFNNQVSGLFNIASELDYITLGGNQAWDWADPDTPFSYDKLKIHTGALTAAQINSLMTTDDIVAPVLAVNTTLLYLDDISKTKTIVVNGANLTSDITITAPSGITVNPTTISKSNATDIPVIITYDGTTVVDGNITLTSGSKETTVAVKSFSNASCFTPLYSTGNMIADPTFLSSTLAAGGFGGWGPTAITTTGAYCGRASAYIRGTCWPDGGSLDRALTVANGNALKPLSTYRLRAMLNSQASEGTNFQFQIEGYDGTASKIYDIPNTNGWVQFDETFTTGETVTVDKGIYFNSCGANTPLITDTCFIDNYELYDVTPSTDLKFLKSNQLNIYSKDNSIVADFVLKASSEVEFSIFNTQGMLLSNTVSVYNAGNNTHTVNVNLTPGVYVVRMTAEGKSTSLKIVK